MPTEVDVDVPLNQAEVPHANANKDSVEQHGELSPLPASSHITILPSSHQLEGRVHHNISTMHRDEADLTLCVEGTKVPVNEHFETGQPADLIGSLQTMH
jgi:hypothetical protein